MQLDRWRSAKELLLATGPDWALRTSRSQVLAAGAAGNHAIESWCAEEPKDRDALVMWARVLTQRVIHAHRVGASAKGLVMAFNTANAACKAAAERWPADPVPGVCSLALAQTDTDETSPRSRLNWEWPRDAMLPPGPWQLLDWVHRRDPYNREAYHRMLGVFHARGRGGLDFAQWVASFAPDGSPLKALPLYAYVESYRRQLEQGPSVGAIAYWTTEVTAHYAQRTLYDWFRESKPSERSLLDLNYLAYVLTVTGVGNAGEVFEAIGPYVTNAPWALVTPNLEWWQDDFRTARRKALSDGSRRR
ncbi:hypothetical protein [Streptomyces sp. NBC_00827]|uniref:hypothetical protein n=1 Tax=Streptomyces sp. NBC_00827 TaxID=2903677 RepID=UPI00386A283F|nr:hypothetical protein OG569_42355 [Streptomyces sp. NBC_00827]